MERFEELYRQHASAVFRFAWGLCGDRNEAEDIVPETFVRLLTRAPKVEARTALAYLLAIARNTFLSGLRRRPARARVRQRRLLSLARPAGAGDRKTESSSARANNRVTSDDPVRLSNRTDKAQIRVPSKMQLMPSFCLEQRMTRQPPAGGCIFFRR